MTKDPSFKHALELLSKRFIVKGICHNSQGYFINSYILYPKMKPYPLVTIWTIFDFSVEHKTLQFCVMLMALFCAITFADILT